MTAEDLRHLRPVGRAAGGLVDYFGGFSEVRRAHDRRGYDGQLLDVLAAEVIEAMHRASRDAQRLPGTNLDGRAVHRPSKDALDTVKHLLVGVVLVGWCRQLLPGGDEKLEHRDAAVGVIAGEKESNPYLTNLNGLLRNVHSGAALLHHCPLLMELSHISFLASRDFPLRLSPVGTPNPFSHFWAAVDLNSDIPTASTGKQRPLERRPTLAKAAGLGHQHKDYWGMTRRGGHPLDTRRADAYFAYFHSQILEVVLPVASTSYSKTPRALFRRASFCEVVR